MSLASDFIMAYNIITGREPLQGGGGGEGEGEGEGTKAE
jgi:hypothetical protein